MEPRTRRVSFERTLEGIGVMTTIVGVGNRRNRMALRKRRLRKNRMVFTLLKVPVGFRKVDLGSRLATP